MMLEKAGGGTMITQPGPDVIMVVQSGSTAKIVGIGAFLCGLLLMTNADNGFSDINFLLGLVIALFGIGLATQRYSMILDRQSGEWSSGSDLFFVIPVRSHGPLSELGLVRITGKTIKTGGGRKGVVTTTYSIAVEARKHDGGITELRFGKNWASLTEAREVAGPLAGFLDRQVQDDSEKDASSIAKP
jgi:hypothetical protein